MQGVRGGHRSVSMAVDAADASSAGNCRPWVEVLMRVLACLSMEHVHGVVYVPQPSSIWHLT